MTRFLALVGILALAACSDAPDDRLHGYVEGDYVLLAPETSGRLIEISVREGEHVESGAVLFRLDDRLEQSAITSADARIEAAAARFDDAAAGGREPEIAAARDQLAQARAAQTQTREDLTRTRELFDRGIIPRARLDTAEASATSANARVGELRERLTLAQLPARENQLRALSAEVAAAEAERVRLLDILGRRVVSAPSAGLIERQLRYDGELAGPANPVLRFLPDGAVHGLIFIPEPELASLPVGSALSIDCDGCDPGLSATIRFIAEGPEFTAPIIYSDNERARLVYRAELRFDGTPPPPGMPISATPSP